MSRNRCETYCYFCDGKLATVEGPRPVTPDDCGVYFKEYEGMIVANAECVDCEAKYLAWLDGQGRTSRGRGWGYDYPTAFAEDGKLQIKDTSFRSSFNDEPGPGDFPTYAIEVKRVRVGEYVPPEWMKVYLT